ncbi:hypothetical protein [Kingella sp. (in: b-proteobacteria)]|uniref:hypothetical protein n=1 Tax=Kingella sp. (in: b-proteobacteria) TaxID=2020713 RepID=UPI0026DC684B|nr:hypothetical protein [Kingella sp. (in: b-proteobacteria)]MDO4656402.1 hypothetical protein [Kingella sp. (in: b-proteobacteria)]
MIAHHAEQQYLVGNPLPTLHPKPFSGCLNAGATIRQPETPPRAPTACLQAVHFPHPTRTLHENHHRPRFFQRKPNRAGSRRCD